MLCYSKNSLLADEPASGAAMFSSRLASHPNLQVRAVLGFVEATIACGELPLRVAEQRSRRGGSPRALFEGEHHALCLSECTNEPELRSGPRLRAAQGNRRATNPGRLFFGHFLLAKQKTVTSCRATPGSVFAATRTIPFVKATGSPPSQG